MGSHTVNTSTFSYTVNIILILSRINLAVILHGLRTNFEFLPVKDKIPSVSFP